jgi:hypothetical protein
MSTIGPSRHFAIRPLLERSGHQLAGKIGWFGRK